MIVVYDRTAAALIHRPSRFQTRSQDSSQTISHRELAPTVCRRCSEKVGILCTSTTNVADCYEVKGVRWGEVVKQSSFLPARPPIITRKRTRASSIFTRYVCWYWRHWWPVRTKCPFILSVIQHVTWTIELLHDITSVTAVAVWAFTFQSGFDFWNEKKAHPISTPPLSPPAPSKGSIKERAHASCTCAFIGSWCRWTSAEGVYELERECLI